MEAVTPDELQRVLRAENDYQGIKRRGGSESLYVVALLILVIAAAVYYGWL
jgi:hypothetical protein